MFFGGPTEFIRPACENGNRELRSRVRIERPKKIQKRRRGNGRNRSQKRQQAEAFKTTEK